MAQIESLARLGCTEEAIQKVAASTPIVVVCTTQEGCPHCHDMKTALREASSGMRGVRILEASCDEPKCADLTKKVKATPSTVVYVNGKASRPILGSIPASEARKVLQGASTASQKASACKVGGTAADRLACAQKAAR